MTLFPIHCKLFTEIREEIKIVPNRIITATGSDIIYKYLIAKSYDIEKDIPYQEGIIEVMKRESFDTAIVSSDLVGDYDKYIFIEKLREISTNTKIIVIVGEIEDNYRSFLYSKGIYHILTDGKSFMEDLLIAIEDDEYRQEDPEMKVKSVAKENNRFNRKNQFKEHLQLKFQRQQIFAFAGIGSSGKTTITTQFSKILAKNTNARILLMDLDIINAGLNKVLGVNKAPEKPGYILSPDKNASLNYMIDAIDKKKFNANIFDRYIVKSKQYSNLDVLTGNTSLYVCKNILSSEYYSRILENAKTIYDYIIIDTSGNIFLDSMQFSLLNATKIFIICEGNYISIERTIRLLTELFPVWGVSDKKIQIVINKYSKNSLNKTTINEVFKKYPIAGYISFSEVYEENLNAKNSKLSLDLEKEYKFFLEDMELIEINPCKSRYSRFLQGILKQQINCF